jgi:hypothetical protein
MGKENYKVVTHNLDVGPEGPIVLSFEFQLNLWGVCELVTFPGSEVNRMNFQMTHWNSRAEDRYCMRTGGCICRRGKISR